MPADATRRGDSGGRARPAPRPAPGESAPTASATTVAAATRLGAGRNGAPSLQVAEALADSTRYRIYELLLDSHGPCSVAEVTDAVGVHHTAVRAHLARLIDVGLVVDEVAEPSGRGRPPRLYRAADNSGPNDDGTGTGTDTDTGSAYRRLAALLAEALSSGMSAQQVGRETGRREAAEARAADPTLDPITALVRHAEEHGFEPEVDSTGTQVTLGRCPYADVAAEDPATICSLHLGVAEGITDEFGGNFTVSLEATDPACAGCNLRLTHQPIDGTPTQLRPR